jgi:ferredoxin
VGHPTLKDNPRALDMLLDVGCMRGGERISDAGAEAALTVYYECLDLKKRVEKLEQRITDEHSCTVCGACLLLPDAPPHCEDCHPDKDQEISWQRKVRKWEEERDKELQKLQGQQQAPGS